MANVEAVRVATLSHSFQTRGTVHLDDCIFVPACADIGNESKNTVFKGNANHPIKATQLTFLTISSTRVGVSSNVVGDIFLFLTTGVSDAAPANIFSAGIV